MKKINFILFVISFVFNVNAQSVALPTATITTPLETVEHNGVGVAEITLVETSNVDVPDLSLGLPNVTISVNLQYITLSGGDVSLSKLIMTANEKISFVNIFNGIGQEVKTIKPSMLEASVDMTNLASGAYFVKAHVGSRIGAFKVIKI